MLFNYTSCVFHSLRCFTPDLSLLSPPITLSAFSPSDLSLPLLISLCPLSFGRGQGEIKKESRKRSKEGAKRDREEERAERDLEERDPGGHWREKRKRAYLCLET